MFLTPEQTGGPLIFSLRQHNRYLAVQVLRGFDGGKARSTATDNFAYEQLEVREFNIEQLAQVLGRGAGETWQEHASLILLACCDGQLFEWLDKIGDAT